MKKILLMVAVVLITVTNINAQKVFSLHAVRVEGNIAAFEKVQALDHKVAQDAVNKGDIAFWAALKVEKFDAFDDEKGYNYVFVQWANSVDELLSTKSAWWNNKSKVLSAAEQEELKTLSATFTWTKDTRDVFVAEDMLNGSGGDYVQFNFGRPANISGFIAENKALWKPFYEKNMTKLNMGGWGVARRLTTGNESDSPTIMSWDSFKTMNDLMKYRIGFTLPKEMTDKSKMSQYMPNGFSSQPIFSIIKVTKDAVK